MTGPSELKFDDRGLIPAVVQHAGSGKVLMFAFMNEEALSRTLKGPDVWFFSRSRNELWHKGSTSGNYLRVAEVRLDCDADAVLVKAAPEGPACHTGKQSCFDGDPLAVLDAVATAPASGPQVLTELFEIIEQRKLEMPDGSYTTSLFREGAPRIAQKVVEEAGEVAIAAVAQSGGNPVAEVADLLYHTLVLLAASGVELSDVWSELEKRRR